MRFKSGDALGMIRALLRSYGLGFGNTPTWKSTFVRTLLATVQEPDVAHFSSSGM